MNLNDAGSVASIASLLITVLIVFQIREIHRHYRRHILLPQFLRQLEFSLKAANHAVLEKNPGDLLTTYKKCDAILERLTKYCDSALQARILNLRRKLRNACQERDHGLLKHADGISGDLQALIQSAYSFKEDDQWKKP